MILSHRCSIMVFLAKSVFAAIFLIMVNKVSFCIILRHGHLCVVMYLIEKAHCEVDCVDGEGSTLLHYCCW